MPDIDLPDVGEQSWGPKLNTAIQALNTAVDGIPAEIANPASGIGAALSATNVQYKQAAKNPDLLIVGAINRNSFGAVTSAAVVWPDGKPGVFTTDVFSTAFPGAIDSYHITHVNGGTTQTYTQPTITRDSNGAATNVPQIVVS